MITTIIDEDNKEHTIVTQQYKVGTYVIIDNDPAQQFNVSVKEKTYHKAVRQRNKFNPDKSTPLK